MGTWHFPKSKDQLASPCPYPTDAWLKRAVTLQGFRGCIYHRACDRSRRSASPSVQLGHRSCPKWQHRHLHPTPLCSRRGAFKPIRTPASPLEPPSPSLFSYHHHRRPLVRLRNIPRPSSHTYSRTSRIFTLIYPGFTPITHSPNYVFNLIPPLYVNQHASHPPPSRPRSLSVDPLILYTRQFLIATGDTTTTRH